MTTADPTQTDHPAPAEVDDDHPTERPGEAPPDEFVESDLLVEDVSIDGMCGVY